MTGTRKWNSGIVARGSIYVANDNRVYAFRIPSGGRLRLLLQQRLHQLRLLLHTNCNATASLPARYGYSDCYGNCDTNCDAR